MDIFEMYKDHKRYLQLNLSVINFMNENNLDKKDSRYIELSNEIENTLMIINKIEELILLLQLDEMFFVERNKEELEELEGLNTDCYIYDEDHNNELKEEFEDEFLSEEYEEGYLYEEEEYLYEEDEYLYEEDDEYDNYLFYDE